MKMRSKKGFTIVELVIVIAVIAILAAVMIPTFSGMVNKAKASAAMQEANNALTVVLAEEAEDMDDAANYYFYADGYWFKLEDQKLVATDAYDGANISKVYVDDRYATIETELTWVDGDDAGTTPDIDDKWPANAPFGGNAATKDYNSTAGDPAAAVFTKSNVAIIEDLGDVIVFIDKVVAP